MRNLTESYIYALTGSIDTIMDWRLINEHEKGTAHKLQGSLNEVYDKLSNYNQNGWGIHVCINAFNGNGNTLADVSYIRTHVVDLDNPLSSNAFYQQAISSNFPPHFAVQSSENKYHLYWLVEPYVGNDFFTRQQRKLNQLYNGDESVTEASRTMRVPGFYHCKNIPTLVKCWSIHNNQRYTFKQIEQFLQHVNIIEYNSIRKPLGTLEMAAPSFEWAVFGLSLHDPNNLTHEEWVTTTAAFKQCAWSFVSENIIKKAWDDWCEKYTKNDVKENNSLWNSLKDTEAGWGYFKRTTTVGAYINSTTGNKQPPVQTIDEENFPDILDTENKKKWFKDCYFVESTGEIFTLSARFMNSTQFGGRYGGKQFILSLSGRVTDEPWKAALKSTDWTIPKVDHIRFLPEKKTFEIVLDKLKRKGLNTYIPIEIDSKQGDVTLWLEHLRKVLPDENDRHIFCSYIAHCIKYPGYKIPWAILLQSIEGAGKSIFKDVIKHALGDMYTYSPKADELKGSGSKFNAWMRSKLAIIVDEIRVGDRMDLIEILKPMITDLHIEIQSKGVDQKMEDNCANWIFFSNFRDAIPINQNSRRYCIFFSPLQHMKDLINAGMDDIYFNRLKNWTDNEGGLQAITYWLLNYPIERGKLPVRAPKTSSYDEALLLSRSPAERTLDEKIDAQEYGFKNGYISYPMYLKALDNSKNKKPADYNIKNILTMKGYFELGNFTHILTNEDFVKPPLIFANDPSLSINDYERMQYL